MRDTCAPKKGFNLSFAISLQKTRFKAVGSADESLVEKMRGMATLGFDGVELAIRKPPDIDFSDLKRGLENSGLKVPALGTGQAYLEEGLSLTHPDKAIRQAAIARIREHIELASRLEALVIIGLIRGKITPGLSPENAFDLLKESLVTCLGLAKKSGVFLALEPINRYECDIISSVPQGLAFIAEIGHPHLKLLADTYHMNIEDGDLRQSLARAAPWLAHVHFADSNRRFPGAGHINFGEIINTLGDIGYSGFISGEMLPEPSETGAMKSFLAFMKSLN